MRIVSRKEWGARPWSGTPATVPLSARTEFFVHWHGGRPPHSTGVAVPREIERIHRAQGWSGVGYNFVVDQDGVVYEGRGWSLQGAHCPGHNVSGLGVQVAIGEGQKPSEKALASVRALYDEACRKTGRALAKKGHRDGYATACPGPDLYAWVRDGMPAGDHKPGSPGGSPPAVARYQVTINGLTYGYGAYGDHVTAVDKKLITLGFTKHHDGDGYQAGPRWTDYTTLNYSDYQRSLGFSGDDADGVPGISSLTDLMGTLPGKKAKKYTPPPFPKGLAPNRKSPSARGLQRALKAAGFMPKSVKEDDNYGPLTQEAVAAFHNKHTRYRLAGRRYDPAIGRLGWAHLHRLAYGK